MATDHFKNWKSYETLLYKFIYGKCTYFAYTLQQSAASATFQPHNTCKISSYTIKIHLLDTATNISRKVTNYVVKQCFI